MYAVVIFTAMLVSFIGGVIHKQNHPDHPVTNQLSRS